jgi:DNA-directed RNA polymerase subunit RPC12/RpoP
MKGIIVKCKHCTKEYDLKKVVEITRGAEVQCPYCKLKVGKK